MRPPRGWNKHLAARTSTLTSDLARAMFPIAAIRTRSDAVLPYHDPRRCEIEGPTLVRGRGSCRVRYQAIELRCSEPWLALVLATWPIRRSISVQELHFLFS